MKNFCHRVGAAEVGVEQAVLSAEVLVAGVGDAGVKIGVLADFVVV